MPLLDFLAHAKICRLILQESNKKARCDGRRVATPQEQDTVLIGPGERYDLVFSAERPGLWLFHCRVVPRVTNDGEYPGGLLIPVITTAKASDVAAKQAAH